MKYYTNRFTGRTPIRPTQINSRGKLNSNEADAVAFLEKYNDEYAVLLNEYVIASWNYETNLTSENAAIVVSC